MTTCLEGLYILLRGGLVFTRKAPVCDLTGVGEPAEIRKAAEIGVD